MNWAREIDDLHAFFEAWFQGTVGSMDRMEAVLDPEFTIVGPHGTTMERDETIGAVRNAHGRSPDLSIATSGHELIAATPDLTVARYIETHRFPETTNRRLSTVVFRPDETAPNGVMWVTVHETFLDRES